MRHSLIGGHLRMFWSHRVYGWPWRCKIVIYFRRIKNHHLVMSNLISTLYHFVKSVFRKPYQTYRKSRRWTVRVTYQTNDALKPIWTKINKGHKEELNTGPTWTTEDMPMPLIIYTHTFQTNFRNATIIYDFILQTIILFYLYI